MSRILKSANVAKASSGMARQLQYRIAAEVKNLGDLVQGARNRVEGGFLDERHEEKL